MFLFLYIKILGNSLVVQWLGLCTFTAKGPGSVPGRGTKIPQAMQHSQKKKIKNIVCGIYPCIKCEVLIQIYMFFQMATQLSQ